MNSEKDKDIACRRCAACCHVDMVAYVSPEDIERWEKEGRYDIIARLRENEVMWAGDRIVNKYGVEVTSCFYLNWNGSCFSCEIYETRPVVCRSYVPGSSELCPLYNRGK
jgi:Fe-S-cluster containining protein